MRTRLFAALVAACALAGGCAPAAVVDDADVAACCECLKDSPRFSGAEEDCFAEEDECVDAVQAALDDGDAIDLETDRCGSIVCGEECGAVVVGGVTFARQATGFGGHWYGVVFLDDTWPTGNDAVDVCEQAGGALVSFQSNDEAFAVKDAELTGWIGLTDRRDEGAWTWADGAPWNPLAVYDWSGGEPNDQGGEDCVELGADGWNDLSCDEIRPAICEVGG
jgi:hypothetical protein